MNEIQARVQEIQKESTTPADAMRSVSRLKAEEAASRWDQFLGKNMEGVATFQTRNGVAQIGAVVHRRDPDGLDSVEVWLGPKAGPPAFRIVNPPILVPDPSGEVIMTERDPAGRRDTIRRYRVDPLQSIAEVVASRQHGEGS